ncbi:hypothetical protein [Streptomyces microflavus]|uniref:hypothetical protein n=1 Tax=Streptomyces microflavus TaxID=1919 RepID=UPI0036E42314
MATNACPAEIRSPTFADGLYAVDREFRMDLVKDLAALIEPAAPEAPAVCILDTGIALQGWSPTGAPPRYQTPRTLRTTARQTP